MLRELVLLALATGLTAANLLGAGVLFNPTAALLTDVPAVPDNTLSTKTLTTPTGLAANPVGHTVQTSWNAANGDAYRLTGGASGTDSACSAVTYGVVGGPAATSFTDARFTPEGHYFCYKVQSTEGATWESPASAAVSAQLGFVAASVAVSGNGNQRIDPGETITINFNQAVDTASGPSGTDTVCSDGAPKILVLGSTTTTGSCNSATETIKAGTMATSNTIKFDARYDATYVWSNGNKTLTITVGTRVFGNKNTQIKGILTLTPASTLLEAAAGNGICTSNAGGGDCLPATPLDPF